MNKVLCALFLMLPISVSGQYRSKVWCADKGDGTYINPVLNADYSDPDVVAVGDDYYLTSSSFNCVPGLPILHSRDLVNWEIIGHALDRVWPDSLYSGSPAHGKGVWAPCIRFHNGEYRIYWGDPDQGVFMVKAKQPQGPWEPPKLILSGFASVITVREMNAEGTRAISEPVIVFDGNGTENRTCEGPKFYKRGGWYWIWCPAGGVSTGFQLALRSRSPFGPYEVKKVLAQGHTPVNGPHQGAWVHTKYGEDWFLHFQDKGAYGRVVHLQPVTWKDNWPVIGRVPERGYCGTPYLSYRKPKSESILVVTPEESDAFDLPRLGMQWQWQANYEPWFGMPTSLGFFRLFTFKSNGNFWSVPNLLLQKTPADSFTATAKLKLVSKGEGQLGGIIMMGIDYSALVVKRVGEGFVLQQMTCQNADKGHSATVVPLADLPKTGQDDNTYQFAIHEEIYLRMKANKGKVHFAFSRDGKHFMEVGEPFKMREGKWIGAKIGFVAQEPQAKSNRGWIDIDWFNITD